MRKHITSIILTIICVNGISQGNGLGLGLILGEPTGISAKFWTNTKNSLDAALAWSFVHDGALYLHGDYVWHNFKLIHISQGKLPFYYGIGARLVAGNNAVLGTRIPLGLNYLFHSIPLDTFIEIVPILDLLPATRFWVNAAIGIRYFFDT